jgi:hypothetical protein
MKIIRIPILALALVGFLATCSKRSTQMDAEITRLRLVDGSSVSTTELGAFIEKTLEKADVTGLSCAIINDGRVVYRKAFGDRTKAPALGTTRRPSLARRPLANLSLPTW